MSKRAQKVAPSISQRGAMNVFTIKPRAFTINDGEICNRIKDGNIKYLHFFLVDDCGGFSLIAKPPGPNELALEKNYKQVCVNTDKMSFRTPKHLLQHVGKEAWCYIERMRPESGELFRIKPIGFRIKKGSKSTQNNLTPYFSNNYIVFPRHYLNKHIPHNISKLQVSFDRSTPEALHQNYLFVLLSDGRFMGRKKFYFLEKRLNNMRTKPLTKLVRFLKSHNKNINSYKYLKTLTLKSCPYGLIVFKEVLSNG